MNGVIAQAVAMTCHGNAWLTGHGRDSFFPGNSTFQFCEFVRFVAPKWSMFIPLGESLVADTPDAWLRHLESKGARGIRLLRSSQYEKFFSDGGGIWTLEVLLPGRISEYWTPTWEVGDRDDPGRRIWRVTYSRRRRRKSPVDTPTNLDDTAGDLLSVLREIEPFAARQQLDGFATYFALAVKTIETNGQQRHGYHQDLAPRRALSERASALLDACQQAWVFGGMGSWNDLMFQGEDQKTYERLSERLFQAVTNMIAIAASSSLGHLAASR